MFLAFCLEPCTLDLTTFDLEPFTLNLSPLAIGLSPLANFYGGQYDGLLDDSWAEP
jgi:hypothetical protein